MNAVVANHPAWGWDVHGRKFLQLLGTWSRRRNSRGWNNKKKKKAQTLKLSEKSSFDLDRAVVPRSHGRIFIGKYYSEPLPVKGIQSS